MILPWLLACGGPSGPFEGACIDWCEARADCDLELALEPCVVQCLEDSLACEATPEALLLLAGLEACADASCAAIEECPEGGETSCWPSADPAPVAEASPTAY